MKSVHITWQEVQVTEHGAFVNVPDDFDADDYALADALAQLQDTPERLAATTHELVRFNREDINIEVDNVFDPEAEALDLTGYEF